MKNIIWSLILVFSSVSVCKAQKVFSVEYENQAEWKNKSKQYLMY